MCICKCENTVKLPFWETIARSLAYVFKDYKRTMQIFSAWMVLFVLLDVAIDYKISKGGLAYDSNLSLGTFIFLAVYLVSYAAIFVATTRTILLKQETKWFQISFGKREFGIIGYSILIGIITVIAAFLLLLIVLFSFGPLVQQLSQPTPSIAGITLITALLLFLIYIITLPIVRLYPLFAAISIDDRGFRLKKAWLLTCGNANRILFGMFITSLPITLLILLFEFLWEFYFSGLGLMGYLIFSILFFAASFTQTALNASYFAHVYQYLTYFQKKAEKVVVSETAVLTEVPVRKEAPVAVALAIPQQKKEPVKASTAKKPAVKKAPVAKKKPAAKKAPAAAKKPVKKAAAVKKPAPKAKAKASKK